MFNDEDLKRVREEIFYRHNVDFTEMFTQKQMKALLARLQGDESLLDRALIRLKLINGPESKCVYADSATSQCENHRLIREIEAWRKECGK